MKVRTVLTILGIPLLLSVGCARGEQAEGEGAGMEEGAGIEEGMATDEMAMGAASMVNLSPLNNSGISGTAEIAHSEEDVTVVLQMSGLEAGDRYPAHIHSGSCEEQGPVAASLSAVEATAEGTGSSTTTVALSELGEMAEGMMMGEGEMVEEEGMAPEGEMGEGEMAEEEGMAPEGEMGEGEMMEEVEHPETRLYVQLHQPDGTPAACANIEPSGEMMMR